MLGGFLQRKGDVETRNRKDDELQQAREFAVFDALSKADDPDVRALALTGLLHTADPRRKKAGLRGWIGEMEQSPYLAQIQGLVASPVVEQKQTLPARQIAGGMAAPSVTPALTQTADANAPAAQPNTSLVQQQGQGAPPTPTSISTSAPPVPYTVSHPRQVFLSPIDSYRQQALAKGEIDEELAVRSWLPLVGGDMAKALEMRRKEKEADIQRRLGTVTDRYAEGDVVPDTTSPTGYSRLLYDARDPTKLQRLPAPAPAPPASSNMDKGDIIPDADSPTGYSRLLYNPQDPSKQQRIPAPAPAKTAGASDDTQALAEMAAKNPAVLQGLTPTVTGSVLSTIAKNPTLRRQYEQTRMEPIRGQAQTVLTTLDSLLTTDANGNVTGLTPGAAALYGMGPGRIMRFLPGSDAANAKAALDQVTGQLTLDLIRSMKDQSRTGATGFGQLSTRELNVLESSATTLKGEISEARALQELTALRNRFTQIMQPGVGEASGPPPPPGGTTPGGQPGPEWQMINGVLHHNGQPY